MAWLILVIMLFSANIGAREPDMVLVPGRTFEMADHLDEGDVGLFVIAPQAATR